MKTQSLYYGQALLLQNVPGCRKVSPVVDHLLKPDAFVQHPHNDEPALITSRQLLKRVVPANAQAGTVVPLQRLVE